MVKCKYNTLELHFVQTATPQVKSLLLRSLEKRVSQQVLLNLIQKTFKGFVCVCVCVCVCEVLSGLALLTTLCCGEL